MLTMFYRSRQKRQKYLIVFREWAKSVQGEHGDFRPLLDMQNYLLIHQKYFSVQGEYAKRI